MVALLLLSVLTACLREPSIEVGDINDMAIALHKKQRLNEANVLYRQVLEIDPPREPDSIQIERVLQYAPRLYTIADEYFNLMDIVAILHPEKSIIAYHLFWEDDIDYPDDKEPCDHEVVWIEYDEYTEEAIKIYTYFHGKILQTHEAVNEANAHNMHAWIGVEWGKHGSLPWDAAGLKSGKPNAKLRKNWERLHTDGIRMPSHLLAQAWPKKFEGNWDTYRDFIKLVDSVDMLEEKQMIVVSRWGNAVLNQMFVSYNFAAKKEWPN